MKDVYDLQSRLTSLLEKTQHRPTEPNPLPSFYHLSFYHTFIHCPRAVARQSYIQNISSVQAICASIERENNSVAIVVVVY